MSQDIVARISELRESLTELQERVETILEGSAGSRRFEDFIRATTDWVWETDANLNYVYVSEGITSVYGLPARLIEGRYLFALNHFRRVDEGVFALIDLIEQRRPFRDVALTVTDVAGKEREILLSGVPAFEDADGRFVGYRGTGIDVTERAAARPAGAAAEAAETVAETAAEVRRTPGYWILDCATETLALAPDLVALLGLDEDGAAPIRLADWRERVAEEDRARFDAALADHIAGRTLNLEIEHRLLAADGRTVWMLLRGQADRAASGEVLHLNAYCTDITAHMTREAQLASESEAARLANRAKTEFLAHLSHELRTPLNAIIGFSEAIKEGYLGPLSVEKSVEYASDVYTASSHLLELINDVLDLSRVEAGKVELAEEELDVAELLDQAVRLAEGRAADGWINLSVEVADGLPKLRADGRLIKQVLLNLLTNAIKFTDRGGSVTVRASLGEDDGLRIAVADTGVGMSADEIATARRPYGQASADPAKRAEGTGLGLPLAESLVHVHGGTLEIASEKGRGTTVTVALPPERSIR